MKSRDRITNPRGDNTDIKRAHASESVSSEEEEIALKNWSVLWSSIKALAVSVLLPFIVFGIAFIFEYYFIKKKTLTISTILELIDSFFNDEIAIIAMILLTIVAFGQIAMSYVGHAAKKFSRDHQILKSKINAMNKQVDISYRSISVLRESERIFLTPRPPRSSGFYEYLVSINPTPPAPKSLGSPSEELGDSHALPERWDLNVSFLDYPAIHHLILSDTYVRHFGSLIQQSKKHVRIVILSEDYREGDLIKSFLAFSYYLGVESYIISKARLEKMVSSAKNARELSDGAHSIIEKQAELSFVGLLSEHNSHKNSTLENLGGLIERNICVYLRWQSEGNYSIDKMNFVGVRKMSNLSKLGQSMFPSEDWIDFDEELVRQIGNFFFHVLDTQDAISKTMEGSFNDQFEKAIQNI